MSFLIPRDYLAKTNKKVRYTKKEGDFLLICMQKGYSVRESARMLQETGLSPKPRTLEGLQYFIRRVICKVSSTEEYEQIFKDRGTLDD